MKLRVTAKSSDGGGYEVDFESTDSCVKVFCSCKAGETGQMCKHKRALIAGDLDMLLDPREASVLQSIQQWPQFERLVCRMKRFEDEVSAVEAEKKAIADKEKKIKSTLGRDLARGDYGG